MVLWLDMEEEQIEEFEQKPSTASRVFRAVVALAVIAGMVYWGGLYQYFFFQRTSPAIEQEELEAVIDAETLVLPVTIFIIQSEGSEGSERTKQDATRLVEQADRIWEQAGINLEILAIHEMQKNDQEIELFHRDARAFTNELEGFDADSINVILVHNLRGLNGLAYGGISVVAVADYTAGYDFRVLAHEIGHKLGLGHVSVKEGGLMEQGADGFELSLEEITTAREFAKGFE